MRRVEKQNDMKRGAGREARTCRYNACACIKSGRRAPTRQPGLDSQGASRSRGCGSFKEEQPNVPLSNGQLSGLPCVRRHFGRLRFTRAKPDLLRRRLPGLRFEAARITTGSWYLRSKRRQFALRPPRVELRQPSIGAGRWLARTLEVR
jgi:hypothetical protein